MMRKCRRAKGKQKGKKEEKRWEGGGERERERDLLNWCVIFLLLCSLEMEKRAVGFLFYSFKCVLLGVLLAGHRVEKWLIYYS